MTLSDELPIRETLHVVAHIKVWASTISCTGLKCKIYTDFKKTNFIFSS